ncbi:MAG TPA: VOC family protein [Trebonia sp.]|nr:VOC family protein [Trebonia sp.]
MTDIITKLLPILHVRDPRAERDFYVRLGLRTTYEGPEYPDFLAVGNEAVEFGLSRKPDADPANAGMTWQLGVSDIEAVIETCRQAGFSFEVTTERPRADWSYRIVTVRSPNGMDVLLEEQRGD